MNIFKFNIETFFFMASAFCVLFKNICLPQDQKAILVEVFLYNLQMT